MQFDEAVKDFIFLAILSAVGFTIGIGSCVPAPEPGPCLPTEEACNQVAEHAAAAYGPCSGAILEYAHKSWHRASFIDSLQTPASRFPVRSFDASDLARITYRGDSLRVRHRLGHTRHARYTCVFDAGTDSASGIQLEVLQ